MYLYIFMVSVFFTYVIGIASKYGILGSISESYYRLPDKWKFVFTFFCWSISIPAIILGDSVFMFLAGTSIAFVGAAASFKEKTEHKVHMIGAFTGVIFSQLSIAFDFHFYWINTVFLSWVLLIVILTWVLKRNIKYFYWIEIVAFLSIIISLYSKI